MKNVEFQQVRIGDRVHVSGHSNRSNPFERCTGIETRGDTVTIVIGVTAHPTIDTRTRIVGHAREGITIDN